MTAKRSGSKGKSEDDILLDKQIEQHQVTYPQNLLLAVGALASFFPTFVANSIFDMLWTSLLNIPIYLAVIASTTGLLSKAYASMAKADFRRRQRHYDEVKTDADAALLRKLRLQAALAYTMFFVNAAFVSVVALLQCYVLRKSDPRVGFAVSSIVAAAGVWFITHKNEEARPQR